MDSAIFDALGQYIRHFPLYTIGTMLGTVLLLALLAALTDDDRRQAFRRWFLLEANRWTITGILVVFVFVASVLLGTTPLVHVAERRFSTTIFSAVTSGLLSLIPIVISVNQLTISKLFATPEQLQDKIHEVQSFRTNIEQQLPDESVAPTDPDAFLLDVNELIAERAATLQEVAANADDTTKTDRLGEYAEKILAETNELEDTVGEMDLPLIQILVPIMDDEHSKNINIAREIREERPETISHRTKTVLEELEDLFVTMDVIRQYFKGLYIQEALANLSKLIAYTGGGAYVLAMFSVMVFVGEKPLPLDPLLIQVVISIAIAISFVPIAVLIAYVARIVTIVKHTVAPGAFTPQKEQFLSD